MPLTVSSVLRMKLRPLSPVSSTPSVGDVVSVTVYVTELDRLTEIHKVRSEFFSKPYPTSTLVQVAGLVHSDLLIEMSAVAVIPRHRFRRPA